MANHPNRSKIKTAASNPTPEQIIALRKSKNLTQSQAAKLVYSTLRTWAGWESGRELEGHRRMHPAIFELFVIKTLSIPSDSRINQTFEGEKNGNR